MTTSFISGSISTSADIYANLQMKQYVVLQKQGNLAHRYPTMLIISKREDNSLRWQMFGYLELSEFDKELNQLREMDFRPLPYVIKNADEIAREIIGKLQLEFSIFCD